MKFEVRKQFLANLKGIKDRELADEIEHLTDLIESLNDIDQISGIKN